MSEWKDKSDDYINSEYAELKFDLSKDSDIQRLFKSGKLNFCNDWSLVGPLIVENKITIEPHFYRSEINGEWIDSGYWDACDEFSSFSVRSESPLRAVVIFLLEMNGVKP